MSSLFQANITRTNHIMWTMGTDFKYQYAHTWFRQMDKFIHYVNQVNVIVMHWGIACSHVTFDLKMSIILCYWFLIWEIYMTICHFIRKTDFEYHTYPDGWPNFPAHVLSTDVQILSIMYWLHKFIWVSLAFSWVSIFSISLFCVIFRSWYFL